MNNKKLLYILAFIFTCSAFVMYWFHVGKFSFGFSSNSDDWADFGSYVGGIFGVLAFLIVVYQNYQRDKEQSKQDFEKTFFMMLEQHNIKLRELEKYTSSNNQSLVDEIYNVVTNLEGLYKIRNEFDKNDKLYSEIDSYFLNLYRILKFIYKNKSFNVDNEYSGLLRSFLSRKILAILAYHLCDREDQYNDYINYVNEFHFFEHLSLNDLEFRFIRRISIFSDVEKILGKDLEDIFKLYCYFYNNYYGDPDSEHPDDVFEFSSDSAEEYIVACQYLSNIFNKKISKNEISNNDLSIDDLNINYELKDFITRKYNHLNEYEGYLKFNPLQNRIIRDDIFLYILNTFSEKAFSTEQENEFKNMKIIYKMFLDKLGKNE